MAALSFDDVTVRRGGREIVSHLTWEVEDGERWVVLGRNGAGKTTLVQLASARMHPTSGTVEVLEERLGRVDVFELRPRIGLASAALAEHIPPDESVLDAVQTASYGVTGRWRETYEELDTDRARALLAAFGMGSMTERTYGTLSEGERKRTQIARALMSDPELLLLDEPAAGLDLGGREELVAALSELAADDRSPVLVVVTHHVEEIPPHFTHALLLRDGTVEAAGPLEEVLTAEHLSATFGVELEVEHRDGRWAARAAAARGSRGRRSA
ncbi:ABC transporter ATP-binding protein [Litorihabitans aurantiacus]|uniref:Iron ABC transporter ATP-binding protein n=1 Tax=Litorihabitans aurantiacus TaxID=1930061 RepID=A0AA37UN49_9MICO|nr:ABC transporter ATP-binding protein [Litorihabitans aurantiacus]GMA31054.1 iron ABC transporter ATP-binding protein [Litorihabitans aurantiacus]